jgi:uncharacterized membrane protein YgdD (TMEM256/DUF423 family)
MSEPTQNDPLRWVRRGAALAALAVAAGAFGAHGLKERVPATDLVIWETAARYHLVHALALVGVGALGASVPTARIDWAGRLLSFGVLVFSGSLYLLVGTGTRWLGAITPIGGVALIAGWLALAAGARRG